MTTLTMCELQQHHIEQAATVLTKSFIFMNSIWKHYNLNYDDVHRIMRGKILPGQATRTNFVLFENDKMVGVSVACDLLAFLQAPTMPNNIPFLKKLAEVGQKMQTGLDLSKIKKGDIIYGVYAVIDPDYASKGYSLRFWWENLILAKSAGFKYHMTRLSSPISYKILLKLGADVLKQHQLVDGELRQKFWLTKLDISKNLPTTQQIQDMLSKKKEPKSKL